MKLLEIFTKTKTCWRKADEQIQGRILCKLIDLVDDYGYTEKEAEEIINDEEKLEKEFDVWLWDTIETGFQVLKTEEEVEDWERMDQ